MKTSRPTLMWEAVAGPRQTDALLNWARREAIPQLGDADVRLFTSDDDRVVIIATFEDGTTLRRVTADPGHLADKPPHQWHFYEVDASPC